MHSTHGEPSLVPGAWQEEFIELVEGTEHHLRLMAPFVRQSVIVDTLQHLSASAEVTLVSSFSIASFSQGVSEVAAFRRVLERGGRVRNWQRLHAKMYIFDDTTAVVTSANLTRGGLCGNYEYGVRLSGHGIVAAATADFDHLADNRDAGRIGGRLLDEIDALLRQLPPKPRFHIPLPHIATEDDEIEPVLENGAALMASALNGWRKTVFDVVDAIPANEFVLADVYATVPELRQQYPDNTHIEPKIRQQLQELRDMGLLRFLGGGKYRKLWS